MSVLNGIGEDFIGLPADALLRFKGRICVVGTLGSTFAGSLAGGFYLDCIPRRQVTSVLNCV